MRGARASPTRDPLQEIPVATVRSGPARVTAAGNRSYPLLPAAHVGLWAPPFGGKTIACVALNHELSKRMPGRSGVAARALYKRGAFPT